MDIRELQKITDLAFQFVDPLVKATASPTAAQGLILELGFVPPPQLVFIEQLGPSIEGIKEIVAQVKALADAGGEPSSEDLQKLLTDLVTVLPPLFELIVDIGNAIQNELAGSPLLTQTDIVTEFPERLLNMLLARFLENNYSNVFSFLQLFGLIEVEEVTSVDNSLKFPYVKYHIEWSKIGDLFTDPKALLLDILRDTNGYRYKDFIYKLQELGLAVNLFSNFRYPNLDVLEHVNNNPNIKDWSGFPELEILRIPFAPSVNPNIGVDIYPLVDTATDKYTGLVMGLGLDTELELEIGELFRLVFTLSANLTNGLGFSIDESDNFKFIADLFTSPESIADNTIVGFKAALSTISTPEEPLFRLGSPDGSRFELGSYGLAFGIEKTDDVHLFVETDFKDGKIVIDFGSADGFVSDIAGSGIESNFDLGIGFSNQRGLYFKGSASLEINIPTHIDLGFLEIQFLKLVMILQNGKLPINVTSTIAANLGPLQAVVEDIGIRAELSFPGDQSGNLGPVDLSLGFKPPNGVGLSLDAGVIKGGGYLYFDFDREEYAGALELVFSEWIALKAIGLVTTRMPDGSKGFSMLIIITVEFGSGLQLGFGFTLLGVGGLLGINRIVNIDALKEGIRTGSVESVMFPEDVIANAPRIISDLRQFFPTQEGVFLIGPMAKIGWGTPTLVSVSLGVILEFPSVNITILGVIKVILPDEQADILRLQVNFIGRFEPSNKLLWFYAELFDSRVLFITLEGGMGLLVNWGDDANFVVSIGGFHPQYNPPPLPFPEPPRIAVSILNESYARVRIEGYFAVTSNSVQFGARAEIFFGVSAFKVEGHLGFDALFQFNPFFFSFSLSFSLSVKVFGIGLFSVGFSGLLEGPTPWHIKGKGSISLLFFSISVPFEHTWGDEQNTQLDPIEVFPLIEAEFNALTNWQAVVPAGNTILVSLRQLGESDEDQLVLHPIGSLRISQRKSPLNFQLNKIGNQKPSDAQKVFVTADIPGGTLALNKVEEKFAIGQFKELDDSNRLSSPGFEPLESGLEVAIEGEQLKTSKAVKRTIRYETNIIDNNFKRHTKSFFKFLITGYLFLYNFLFGHFLKGNAVSKSVLSQNYKKQLQPFEEVIAVKPQEYSVALNTTNQAVDASATSFSSQAKAQEYLQQQLKNNPALNGSLHVIPNTELNQAA